MTDLDDLRFPVGRFVAPGSGTRDLRAAQIETLRLLPERLRDAVAGLNEAQFDTPYREGGWTVRQVVHHVADSHANSYMRFKLALTEDGPTIKPYDEAAWANLADSRLPVDVSLAMIAAVHARWSHCWGRFPKPTLPESSTIPNGAAEPGRESGAIRLALAGITPRTSPPARAQGW